METKINKSWKVGKYEITLGFLLESKTIYFIDCICRDFEFRKIKKVGEFADTKYFADSCKHIKPYLKYYESQGFKLRVPEEMKGPDKCSDRLRKELLERANYECESCGSDNKLVIHRRTRGSNGGKYNLKNCEVLCYECHKIRHSNEFK